VLVSARHHGSLSAHKSKREQDHHKPVCSVLFFGGETLMCCCGSSAQLVPSVTCRMQKRLHDILKNKIKHVKPTLDLRSETKVKRVRNRKQEQMKEGR